MGIIKIKDEEIFVYESARHHHNKVDKEGVQEVPLNYYKDRDWYVRKCKYTWIPTLDDPTLSVYSEGYNCCMWDWCRARWCSARWCCVRTRCCPKWSKKTFCSEYVALQLGLENPDLMTPKDLAHIKVGKLKNYGKIEGPISKEVFSVYNPMRDSSYKFKF